MQAMTISAAERITAFLRALILAIAGAMSLAVTPVPVAAQDYGLEGEARYALSRLMASHPSARMLDQRAYATLVFPDITKADSRRWRIRQTACCSGAVALRVTTTSPGYRTVFEQERSPTAWSCSS